MEQQKHTPGPWEAEWHRKYKQWNVFPESGKAVVSVTDLCGEYSKEETEANARLIAAAPDLLEALKAIVSNQIRCLEDNPLMKKESRPYPWVEMDIHRSDLDAARAAIAKATGEK